MTDTIISVEKLSKAYRIGLKEEIPNTLAGVLSSWAKTPFRNLKRLSRLDTFSVDGVEDDIHWALKDVSFEVSSGEVVGIIGRNGAGKSTLLKILSRITQPTSGRAVIRGRVSSLLEVGTGFHPELSGRENIYMNGTILGMKKSEIDGKFEEIVNFSAIKKFLDTPIKRYSSGMKVRLAFAVAAHLEPEILVIDEVLAVGDQEFQHKCLGKMQDVASSGRTVLFVSHNMAAVESLCSRAILLRKGEIALAGPVGKVVADYLNATETPDRFGPGSYRNGTALIREVRLVDAKNATTDRVEAGTDVKFIIRLHSDEPLVGLTARIVLSTANGVRICNCNSRIETNKLFRVGGRTTVTAILREQRLAPGRYFVSVGIFYHGQELESAEPAFAFEILPTDIFGTGLLPSAHKAIYLPVCDWHYSNESMAKLEAQVVNNE